MKASTGGFAFPQWDARASLSQRGLTVRDWFAGMALQGLLAGTRAPDPGTGGSGMPGSSAEARAAAAYILADAMLAERERDK